MFSWVPSTWGNAVDWLPNAQKAGFATSTTPSVGSIAVWGTKVGQFGHVAAVQSVNADGSFIVREMNWNAFNTIDTRTITASEAAAQGVIGFILPPGSKPGQLPAMPGSEAGIAVGQTTVSGVDSFFKQLGSNHDPCNPPSDEAAIFRMIDWVSCGTNWWRVLLTTTGAVMIVLGAYMYFIRVEAPSLKEIASIGELAAL